MKRKSVFVVAALAALLMCSTAWADVLDPFDNAPAPPGAAGLGLYISYQDLPEYEDENAGTIDIGVKAPALIFRPIWFGPKIAGKLSWGLNAIIPLVNVDATGAESQSGLGDIAISPFIFLVESEANSFYLSFWEFIYTPTGKYDKNNPDTSPGLDAWQFQHQLAVGWYPAPFGVDWTFNYWQRLESDELEIDYQDAIESDLILHYTFDNKLTLGVIGSFWWDVDDLKVAGTTIPDTKGHRYAAGINVLYPLKEDILIGGRWTHDFDVQNHTKGDWFYLRLLFLF